MEHRVQDKITVLDANSYTSTDQGKTRFNVRDLSVNLLGHQEILTENHPGFVARLEGDQGGPFQSHKTEVAHESSSSDQIGDYLFGYSGPLGTLGQYNHGTNSVQGDPFSVSTDTTDRLFALGGTAVSRTLPTNPVGGAATFLGELREGFPSLIGSTLFRDRAKEALKAQKAGSEYLNVEFGWKPLVADLRKFALGVKKHDKIVSQLSRDSGRNVRRRYQFPVEEDVLNVPTQYVDYALGDAQGGALVSYLYAGQGKILNSKISKKETWFSGCYTYHLPDYNEYFGVKRYLAEADKVLGVKITPEVLWNLAPWSWAADWFANTGDVFTNLTQFSQNDFAMRYGYLMQRNQTVYTTRHEQPLREWGGGVRNHYAQRIYTSTALRRVPASPFGFGFTFSDFSPRQLAITSALGISRVR